MRKKGTIGHERRKAQKYAGDWKYRETVLARVNISHTLLITSAQLFQQEPWPEHCKCSISDYRGPQDPAQVWLCSSLAMQWSMERSPRRESPSLGFDTMCTSMWGGITLAQ